VGVGQGPTPEQQRAQRFGSIGGIREVLDGAAARRPIPPLPVSQQDDRDVRVDAICDKILAELRTAPQAVKDIFIKPEETVAALRATCRDLSRRDRELRKFLAPGEDERLLREREALQKRIDAEVDEVTKMRLASALAALDQQRDQRLELKRAAARFDAEHTRISYTLESLHTQVVRMRSADSSSVDVAGAGLRRSLDMLSHEVNALADALEKVNSGEAERMRKVASGPASDTAGQPPAPGTREKA
jgi:seryl-tRNA synthetase